MSAHEPKYCSRLTGSTVSTRFEIIAKDALLKGIMVSAALHPNPEKIFKVYEAAGFERQNGFMFKNII